MMVLSELLESRYKNVKVGAKGGSGFIYCGAPQNIDFEALNKEMKLYNHNALISATNRYEGLKTKNVSADRYVASACKNNEPVSFEGYIGYLKNHFRELGNAETAVKKAGERINEYTELEGRNIVDSYKSITEPNTTIVIYEGFEKGSAWTTEEYERGYFETEEVKR